MNSGAVPSRAKTVDYVLIALGAFILYWYSSYLLATQKGTTYFGADTWYYAELAKENIFGRIKESYFLERIVRFHSLTVVLSAGWMEIFRPLSGWIAPLQILKAMFAVFGALGTCAALFAFNTLLPRRDAILCAIIYAVALGTWYFSSIEESKIVTTSLTTLYIASYLWFRNSPTARGIALLTIILLLGCLNEIVFAFVVVLPLADTIVKDGPRWRQFRWIFLHALAAPLALLLVEGIVFARLPVATHPEGASHFAMFFHYLQQNFYSFATLHEFLANWFCFNILAPAASVNSKGYFQPLLANYLYSHAAVGAVVVFGVMIAASLLPRYRAGTPILPTGILLGLLAFSLIRAAFFFVFDPAEPLLFAAPTTLGHLMIVLLPFAASSFPARNWWLAAFATAVFVNNGLLVLYSAAFTQ